MANCLANRLPLGKLLNEMIRKMGAHQCIFSALTKNSLKPVTHTLR